MLSAFSSAYDFFLLDLGVLVFLGADAAGFDEVDFSLEDLADETWEELAATDILRLTETDFGRHLGSV